MKRTRVLGPLLVLCLVAGPAAATVPTAPVARGTLGDLVLPVDVEDDRRRAETAPVPEVGRAGEPVAGGSTGTALASDPAAAARATAYLATQVVDGSVEGSVELTALSTLALLATGGHGAVVAETTAWLGAQAADPALDSPERAMIALVAAAQGLDPRAFGGTDLVAPVAADLADGTCSTDGSPTLASLCALALARAAAPVPQAFVDAVRAASSTPDAAVVVDGAPDAWASAFSLQALAALDAMPFARETGLGLRDFLWGYSEPDGPFDSSAPVVVNALVAQSLSGVGEAVAAEIAWLRAVQLPDGGLPLLAGESEADVLATATGALALLGRGLASGPRVVDYGPHPYVLRSAGADRYQVAANVAAAWTEGAQTVVIASGEKFADALPGSALAAHHGGPVLLTRRDSLPGATATMLRQLRPRDIIILGGEASVSRAVATALGTHVNGGTVHRVSGQDRYEVSANAAAFWPRGSASQVYLATGQNWPDGLTGGAEAGRNDTPLFLTRAGSVPASVIRSMRNLGVTDVVVVGGTASISRDVEDQLNVEGFATGRIAGSDRYTVAANLAWGDAEPGPWAFAATGLNWPDALTSGPLAAALSAPLVLLRQGSVPAPTADRIRHERAALVTVLGGTASVSADVAGDLRLLRTNSPFEP